MDSTAWSLYLDVGEFSPQSSATVNENKQRFALWSRPSTKRKKKLSKLIPRGPSTSHERGEMGEKESDTAP
jgi:hypothetical protein